MFYFEVIFSKSFRSKYGNRVPTTVTQLFQSKEFLLSDAEEDCRNKAEKHPLAKAGWLFTVNNITRLECQLARREGEECHLYWATKIANQVLSKP